MKEIKNFKDLKAKVEFGQLPYELMKDIVYQVYLFETEFDPTQIYSESNAVVLVDSISMISFFWFSAQVSSRASRPWFSCS